VVINFAYRRNYSDSSAQSTLNKVADFVLVNLLLQQKVLLKLQLTQTKFARTSSALF
jgi:hypothetical protein